MDLHFIFLIFWGCALESHDRSTGIKTTTQKSMFSRQVFSFITIHSEINLIFEDETVSVIKIFTFL